MNQPNRAQRRQMERDGLVIPPGGVPNLGAMANMPDMPTLGEQRRSAAIQLAIQGIHSFDDADEMVKAASTIEGFLCGNINDNTADDDTSEDPAGD